MSWTLLGYSDPDLATGRVQEYHAGSQWGMLGINAIILGIFLVVAVACTILFHIFSFKKHRDDEEEGQKIAG